MSNEIDNSNLPQFPEKLGEKLKEIRERLGMTPDQLAPFVGAKTGAEIVADRFCTFRPFLHTLSSRLTNCGLS